MRFYHKIYLSVAMLLAAGIMNAQDPRSLRGKIMDSITKEPISGATVTCNRKDCRCGCVSAADGSFELRCNDCDSLVISSIGYPSTTIPAREIFHSISLASTHLGMSEIVVSATRGAASRRSESPVAISTVSAKTIQETKAVSIDQLLNKISGVNMVNLGNEQHAMSIRQPMTTRSLFLYLEDGIPIRTSGLFNHNALIEINMTAVKNIEVIKGPSSSLYGSEAIGGVVNFITATPFNTPVTRLALTAGDNNYKRIDLLATHATQKHGVLFAGYFADRRNGPVEHSDFRKVSLTARFDQRPGEKLKITHQLSYINYYSDMGGTIDSVMYAKREWKNLQSFTYRDLQSFRYHSTLSYQWNPEARTLATVLYRNNTISQNPAYRIKDDYRRVNGTFTGKKDRAHGEINSNRFTSIALITQHRQEFKWKKAVLLSGLTAELSPSAYSAEYIRIKKDSVSGKYLSYQQTDSTLTDHQARLNNYSGFMHAEFCPAEKLRIVVSTRYDLFIYRFNNHLPASAFSGAPDSDNRFQRVSLKTGLTYNFNSRTGLYANYSEGFVPPQVTELYSGVKVPVLEPSVFQSLEAGARFNFIPDKLVGDLSLYRMKGFNEIVSVKQDDGTFLNQNTGQTLHFGAEAGLQAKWKQLTLNISASVNKHQFIAFTEKGVSYNGKEMNGAPRVLAHLEMGYKPVFVKGLRISMEWQRVGAYFADPLNTASYGGYDLLNFRTGYRVGKFECWVNVINLADNYYATMVTKNTFGYSYQPGEQRNIQAGVSLDLSQAFKKRQ